MKEKRREPRTDPTRPHAKDASAAHRQDGTSTERAAVRLQGLAGNAAVSAALAAERTPGRSAGRVGAGSAEAVERLLPATMATGRPTVQRSEPRAPTTPFELGGLTIATYAEAASALRLWCAELAEESAALTQGKVALPPELSAVRERGLAHARLLEGGEAEPLDRGNSDDIRAWHGDYFKAVNGESAGPVV